MVGSWAEEKESAAVEVRRTVDYSSQEFLAVNMTQEYLNSDAPASNLLAGVVNPGFAATVNCETAPSVIVKAPNSNELKSSATAAPVELINASFSPQNLSATLSGLLKSVSWGCTGVPRVPGVTNKSFSMFGATETMKVSFSSWLRGYPVSKSLMEMAIIESWM